MLIVYMHWKTSCIYSTCSLNIHTFYLTPSTHPLSNNNQVPSPTGIANSFKKLMRACSPSGSQYGASEAGYMTAIQESLWMDQLSLLMQLAGAVADLIDIQGSSVLVCLENGWDTTAQVGYCNTCTVYKHGVCTQ